MSLLQVCSISILGLAVTYLLKPIRPEFSFMTGLAICLFLFGAAMGGFSEVVLGLSGLSGYLGEQGGYLKLLLKMFGVTYLCEFCAGLCKDAGQGAIAGQVELWGKLCIMAAGIPVIYSVIECIRTLSF